MREPDDRRPSEWSDEDGPEPVVPLESPDRPAGSGLPVSAEHRFLGFYDRLRERILASVERRGSRLGERAVRALLLVPDVFMLLLRLTFDRDVPGSSRALIGGALAYFLVPLDLMPEIVLGGAGYLDDVVLASIVLAHAFGEELAPYAARHWSGSGEVATVVGDLSGSASSLLGEDLWARVKRVLRRRGVVVEDEP